MTARLTADRLDRVTENFTAMGEGVNRRLGAEMVRITADLTARIKAKLDGPVLHVSKIAHPHLRDSVHGTVRDLDNGVEGIVGAGAGIPYARIHEYGGRTPPHDIVAKNGQALKFMIGGETFLRRVVHHPGSVMPERSYMRSTLAENAEDIRERLRRAVEVGP